MDALANDELVFTETANGVSISYKQYLKDDKGQERGAKLFSIVDGIYTQEGTNELRDIFDGNIPLPFPKPKRLIQKLVELVTEENDIILDSFAGSGTTAHGVLEQNVADDENRTFILVQMPYETKEQEKDNFNICQKITAERVQKIVHGYSRTNQKGKKERVEGLGGSFTYVRVGAPLIGEYRDLGKKLPAYEELAKYIFYTETSRDFDRKALSEKTGKIGEHNGTSYYLLYTPDDKEDRALDSPWLQALDKREKNRNLVVYCEKIWIHRDDLAKFERETGRTVRPMLVPFNLK